MKRLTLDDQLFDDLIAETEDDPMGLVPADLRHLVPGFLDRRENEVRELSHFLAEGKFAEIKAIGHKLKGTGVGFGFPVITEIGRSLETGAANADQTQLRDSITELKNFTAGLKSFLILNADN